MPSAVVVVLGGLGCRLRKAYSGTSHPSDAVLFTDF